MDLSLDPTGKEMQYNNESRVRKWAPIEKRMSQN